ncbi:MAG: class E sortase [Candidatus Chisholmbacteria bacterium]|nr:class E sortase [Candidatus Chisholmbacteria bacterium]
MNNTKQYQPNSLITLFDRNKDSKIAGTLYVNLQLAAKETVVSSPQAKEWLRKKYNNQPATSKVATQKSIFRTLAALCLLIFILGFASLILPVAAAEFNLRMNKLNTNEPEVSLEENKLLGSKKKSQIMNEVVSDDFKIVIPKINLEANVVENVDPATPELYKEQLKHGVAHAKGSYFPGEGSVFLFAHSTDSVFNILNYDAKFYGVKELESGDVIYIYFKSKRYKYIVENKLILAPYDLDTIRSSQADLILSTCWPPGTDWQRLITFARLESN